jgi:hypothetical protein
MRIARKATTPTPILPPMPIFEPVDKPPAAALGWVREYVGEVVDGDVETEDVETDEVVIAFGFWVVGLPLLINSS